MVFENLVCGKLGNFNNFINRKYLLSNVIIDSFFSGLKEKMGRSEEMNF